jgi:hypothetical protein
VVLAALVLAAVFSLGIGGEPSETMSVSNERDGIVVVEVYEVGSDATVQVERADGTTTAQRPGDVEALENVRTVLVPGNTSREAILVFPNGAASADATETGSRFVYVAQDGDPDGRTYLDVGLVDCGDDDVATTLVITETSVRVEGDRCE